MAHRIHGLSQNVAESGRLLGGEAVSSEMGRRRIS